MIYIFFRQNKVTELVPDLYQGALLSRSIFFTMIQTGTIFFVQSKTVITVS